MNWQNKTGATLLLLLLVGGIVYAQSQERRAHEKMKTIRLHIDGFSKSKSGAV